MCLFCASDVTTNNNMNARGLRCHQIFIQLSILLFLSTPIQYRVISMLFLAHQTSQAQIRLVSPSIEAPHLFFFVFFFSFCFIYIHARARMYVFKYLIKKLIIYSKHNFINRIFYYFYVESNVFSLGLKSHLYILRSIVLY